MLSLLRDVAGPILDVVVETSKADIHLLAVVGYLVNLTVSAVGRIGKVLFPKFSTLLSLV